MAVAILIFASIIRNIHRMLDKLRAKATLRIRQADIERRWCGSSQNRPPWQSPLYRRRFRGKVNRKFIGSEFGWAVEVASRRGKRFQFVTMNFRLNFP
jgi:hypothetical protein